MKSQKPCITDYNLLIMQDLWQSHYQILLIIYEGIHKIKSKYGYNN